MKLKVKARIIQTTLTISPLIWNNNYKGSRNPFTHCVMQYDTGAFMTVVDYSIVERYGYEIIRPVSIYDPTYVKGIGGYVPAEYTIIPNIKMNGIELGSVYACVVDFSGDRQQRNQQREDLLKDGKESAYAQDSTDVKAIIGLNFIRGFRASTEFITRENAILTLEPKFDLCAVDKGDDFSPLSSIFGSFYSEFSFRRSPISGVFLDGSADKLHIKNMESHANCLI